MNLIIQAELYVIEWIEVVYGREQRQSRMLRTPKKAAEIISELERKTREMNPDSYVSKSVFITYRIAGTPL